MIDQDDPRERELTRLREEIIRTTKQIIRMARHEPPRRKEPVCSYGLAHRQRS
jgi:hypothetical protein